LASGKLHRESAFEAAIEASLIAGGWTKIDASTFDTERGLDVVSLLSWLEASQPEEMERLQQHYGPEANSVLFKQLTKALTERGSIDVLRRGIALVPNIKLALCQFQPPSGLNPETMRRYDCNVLGVSRQVPFSGKHPGRTIDLVLFLNGLPVATAELKNELTRQTYRHAEAQYREGRVPAGEALLTFKRCVAHFCVDPTAVSLTTRLAGERTRFIPFNRGDAGGAGNPPTASGFRTAYLWERVWSKNLWLDILARFVVLQVEEERDPTTGRKRRKETLVFPRWHQLDAVLAIEADVRAGGVGRSYLIEHSAGSGKSNTIAWTAHRLAQLFDADDRPVFDSVIVATDRVVLDRQLQNTVSQFEQTVGTVVRIDGTSRQLKEAIEGRAQIIISTVQKFGVIVDTVAGMRSRRFAVVIDEAHSGQGGQQAGDLVRALSKDEDVPADLEEQILAVIEGRGPQPNLSFLAFTATPKKRTIERFGRLGPDGKPVAFHRYPMRQAIEENFILDVLKNYTTYRAYYALEKAIEADPELDKRKAQKAVGRWLALHPYNIEQKVRIVVEHFRRHVLLLLDRRAKAMVATSSRLLAVRWWRATKAYLSEAGYDDMDALVAFSGEIEDPEGAKPVSERELNGFRETELPEKFRHGQWNLLIVAEKYQTGYDEPLLCALYVDKRLDGLQAVQTLSRLNRTHPGKDSVFVLDFENDAEAIQDAFRPYYEGAEIDEPTDPHQVYTLSDKLMGFGFVDRAEVEETAAILFAAVDSASEHRQRARLESLVDAARDRFKAEPDEDRREEFRHTLVSFLRFYGFIAQIVNLADTWLEKLYRYGRLLAAKLPRGDGAEQVSLGDDELRLVRYKLARTFSGSAALQPGEKSTLTGPVNLGTGKLDEAEQEMLSEIIRRFNERFGTAFSAEDWVNFQAAGNEALNDARTRDQALHNPYDVFFPVFEEKFMQWVIEGIQKRSAQSQRDFKTASWLTSDAEARRMVADLVAKRVWREVREKRCL
jgi:type I restriction enzyme R subunit